MLLERLNWKWMKEDGFPTPFLALRVFTWLLLMRVDKQSITVQVAGPGGDCQPHPVNRAVCLPDDPATEPLILAFSYTDELPQACNSPFAKKGPFTELA